MKRALGLTVVLGLICPGGVVQADVFNMGPGLTSLQTVFVGDSGNVGELSGSGAGYYGPDRICGSVDYGYYISKYEVTAGQYTKFLNAVAKTDTYGLYNTNMWTHDLGCKIQRHGEPDNYTYSVAMEWANRPANYVSFWDACRFANWLHNGQPEGSQDISTTEGGAYTLTSEGITNNTIARNASWQWAVTSEDEWYKAAYYKGGGTDVGYWDYPTQSDTIGSNMANYANSVGHTTDVGSYLYPSAYGTFDQGGNVWEWNEGILYDTSRGRRGGSFDCYDFLPPSGARTGFTPTYELYSIGFRVSAVPEPSSMIGLAGGLGAFLVFRRRRRPNS